MMKDAQSTHKVSLGAVKTINRLLFVMCMTTAALFFTACTKDTLSVEITMKKEACKKSPYFEYFFT